MQGPLVIEDMIEGICMYDVCDCMYVDVDVGAAEK